MRRALSCVGGALLTVVVSSTGSWAEGVSVVDDSYAFYRDKTTYDPDTDVIVTEGVDVDFGSFWIAMQCSSDAVWRPHSLTGDWKPRESLPEDMKIFHDLLCSMRSGLPYLAFRVEDVPQPR